MLNEGVTWKGRIRITLLNADGSREVVELDNLIVDTGLNMMRRALRNGTEKTQILYTALGSDNTAVASSDTTLGSEQFRKQVTAQSLAGTGALTTTTYIAPAEANTFTIYELGWYAGTATGTTDSGVLVARVVLSGGAEITKDDTQALQIDRTDTFS